MPLKLYTAKSYLPENKTHTIMLYPFWGNPEDDITNPDYGRFDSYVQAGKNIFEIVAEPSEAAAFLLPFEFSFDTESLIQVKHLDNLAKQYNKKIITFYNSDFDKALPIANAIIFRTSFYKSKKKPNEYAIPGWSANFLTSETKNLLPALVKPKDPVISYCGYIDYITLKQRFHWWRIYKKVMRKTEKMQEIGPILRGKAIRTLLKDKRIKTNFIIRNGFWAAGMDKKTARNEYIKNMMNADYALVVRGAGNFSYRLYEALSLGKIPVFIDTDCVLPFDNFIDWKKYVVWINENEISNISQKLIEFHNRLSTKEYNELKLNCRKLYEEWICPLAFFSNIHKYII